jgi:uncharacterized protein
VLVGARYPHVAGALAFRHPSHDNPLGSTDGGPWNDRKPFDRMRNETSIRWTEVDWKGVTAFLLMTFVITFVIEGALILNGVSPLVRGPGQYVVAAVMWVPGLAAALTIRFITHEGFGLANIRFGGWRPYATVGLVVPACFVIVYGLTWLMGLGQPDWALQYFKGLFVAAGEEVPRVPSPAVIWPAFFVVSVFIGPFINSVLAFGEELGWRGYLLPKLLPLGKFWAYALVGVIWGAWHWPLVLVGFMYPGHPLAGVVMFTTLTTVFGAYVNELTLRHRSSILAGWVHGVFNTQRLGMWALLFPNVNPWLGGFSGALGICIWSMLSLWESRHPTR